MTIPEQLIGLRLRKPFVPFRITLKDGRTLLLTDAHRFAVSPYLMIILEDRPPALRVRTADVVSVDVLQTTS
ncbi:MAG TPA: hypothetical protein VGI81_04825 [Tepidisphaeraceae bacterium]|jgi:hypothetical protein